MSMAVLLPQRLDKNDFGVFGQLFAGNSRMKAFSVKEPSISAMLPIVSKVL